MTLLHWVMEESRARTTSISNRTASLFSGAGGIVVEKLVEWGRIGSEGLLEFEIV